MAATNAFCPRTATYSVIRLDFAAKFQFSVILLAAQLKEYSSLQENPYNVRYIHTVLIIHIYFAPQAVGNV